MSNEDVFLIYTNDIYDLACLLYKVIWCKNIEKYNGIISPLQNFDIYIYVRLVIDIHLHYWFLIDPPQPLPTPGLPHNFSILILWHPWQSITCVEKSTIKKNKLKSIYAIHLLCFPQTKVNFTCNRDHWLGRNLEVLMHKITLITTGLVPNMDQSTICWTPMISSSSQVAM